jgi:hypothetical protein
MKEQMMTKNTMSIPGGGGMPMPPIPKPPGNDE